MSQQKQSRYLPPSQRRPESQRRPTTMQTSFRGNAFTEEQLNLAQNEMNAAAAKSKLLARIKQKIKDDEEGKMNVDLNEAFKCSYPMTVLTPPSYKTVMSASRFRNKLFIPFDRHGDEYTPEMRRFDKRLSQITRDEQREYARRLRRRRQPLVDSDVLLSHQSGELNWGDYISSEDEDDEIMMGGDGIAAVDDV